MGDVRQRICEPEIGRHLPPSDQLFCHSQLVICLKQVLNFSEYEPAKLQISLEIETGFGLFPKG